MPKTKKRTTNPKVTLTLGMFDSHGGDPVYREHERGTSIKKFDGLGLADYIPRGMTPLRDASALFIASLDTVAQQRPDDVTIGLLVDESGSMQSNRESVIKGINEFVDGMRGVDAVDSEAGGKVLAVIFTDGLENASRETTAETLADLIAEKEEAGWTFIYLGSNQDAWEVGTTTGLSGGVRGQTVSYDSSPEGTSSAFASVTSDAVGYLGDQSSYNSLRSASPSRRLSKDGNETVDKRGPKSPKKADPASGIVLPPEPEVESYGNIADALKQAKGEK